MKAIPKIQKYMTANPHTINDELSLAKAQSMMREFKIRHLPVLSSGKVVGLISERDIGLLSSLQGVDPEKTAVGQAMAETPYLTSSEASLDEVAAQMAEKKFGSAIVMDNHKVVGIFTAVDGLRALSDLLRTRLG